MCERLLNITELNYLWKTRGNKDYNLKNFLTHDGTSVNYILFEDLPNRRNVFGKIVKDPREGEAYHWPRLEHPNLAPLLETVALNEKISIYILPAIGLNLKNVIHDKIFKMDTENFNRKRNYVKDILLALDYLHGKSLCVMNLTERIFYVSDASDKAVLCNFQCVHLTVRVTKEDLDLPILYEAPELKTEYFDPIAAEAWACGVMFLQIFTNDVLPSAFIGEEVKSVLQAVKEINYDIIKEASPGSDINFSMIKELLSFLNLFLVEDPRLRTNIQNAAASDFLKSSRRMEFNNGFKSALWPSNTFQSATSSGKSKQVASNIEKRFVSPFEDIYLKEKANCRDKLKKAPCTNKFINLKFIPLADSTTKHLDRSRSREKEKNGVSDQNKEKLIVEQTSRSFELHSEYKPKGSLAGDSKTMPTTSRSAENLRSSNMLNNTENSNTEDKLIGDNKIASITSEFSENFKCSRFLIETSNSNTEDKSIGDNKIVPMTSELAENFKCSRSLNETSDSITEDKSTGDNEIVPTRSEITEYLKCSRSVNETSNSTLEMTPSIFEDVTENVAKNGVFYDSIFAPHKIDDIIKPPAKRKNFNETEHSEVKCQTSRSPSDSDISLDSLDLYRNKLEQACDTSRTQEFTSHGTDKYSDCDSKTVTNTEDFCASEDETSLCLKIVHLNTVFKIKNAFEQNLLNDRQSFSDLSTRSSIDVKDDNADVDSSTSIENNNEKNYRSHEIERKHKSGILMLEANVEAFSQINVSNDAITLNHQELEEPKEAFTYDNVDLPSDENGKIKTGGYILNVDENAKEDKIEEVSFNSSQNVQQIKTSPVVKNNAENDSSTSIKNNNKNDHESYEIERKYKSEILNLEANVAAFSQIRVLGDVITPNNQELKEAKDALTYDDNDVYSERNGKIKKEGNLFNFGESAEEDKTEKVSFNNFQNLEQIGSKLCRNNYPEIAITRDTAKNETLISTEETKLKVKKKRSFLKIPFIRKKSPAAKKNAENDNDNEIEKIQNNLSVLANEYNIGVSQIVTNMAELLDSPPVEKSEKNKKRKWIRFFSMLRQQMKNKLLVNNHIKLC